MKELLAGIVLVLVIGIGGFLYRNEVERPLATVPPAPLQPIANTTQSIGSTTPNVTASSTSQTATTTPQIH